MGRESLIFLIVFLESFIQVRHLWLTMRVLAVFALVTISLSVETAWNLAKISWHTSSLLCHHCGQLGLYLWVVNELIKLS